MDIKNKVALVTGAAGGIGEKLARLLAQEGARVCLVDKSPKAEVIAEDIVAHGGIAKGFVYDVTDPVCMLDIIELAAEWGGDVVRILVPAAAIPGNNRVAVRLSRETGKPDIFPDDEVERIVDINLNAPVRWALEVAGRIMEDASSRHLPDWTNNDDFRGVIVLVSSVVAQTGSKGSLWYSITKAGLVGAFRTLRLEWKGKGIAIKLILPGYTQTDILKGIDPNYLKSNMLQGSDDGNLISPEEIAGEIRDLIRKNYMPVSEPTNGWTPQRADYSPQAIILPDQNGNGQKTASKALCP